MTSNGARVLVTGAAGFIGRRLSRALLTKGCTVTMLDQAPITIDAPGARAVVSDVRDSNGLVKAITGHDMVFHLASNTENRPGLASSRADLAVTAGGTVALLDALATKPPNVVVLTSTQLVYGGGAGHATEDATVLRPETQFAAGKAAAEAFLSAFGHRTGAKTVACRLANIVGPGITRGVVHDLSRKLRASPDHLQVLGDGQQRRSYVHVDDCVSALMLTATAAFSEFEVFNVSNVDTVTVAEIAQAIVGLRPQQSTTISFTDQQAWQGDATALHPDPSKLIRAGWAPAFSSLDAVIAAARYALETARD